jgi:hypothetical protein
VGRAPVEDLAGLIALRLSDHLGANALAAGRAIAAEGVLAHLGEHSPHDVAGGVFRHGRRSRTRGTAVKRSS